jgi:hypothetical protein
MKGATTRALYRSWRNIWTLVGSGLLRLHRSQFTTKTKIQGTMKKLARPGTMRLGTVTERGREGEAQADMLYVGVDAHKAYSQM